MYSSTSYPSGAYHRDQSNEPHGRQSFAHSHSQPFLVAGMSSQGTGHSPSLRSGPLGGGTGGLSDTLSQSRSHYQSGYLMAASQHDATSLGPRFDDAPLIQTKAKTNPLISGSSAAEFGMDSMFQSSRQRQRQTLADEDAPPMNSVNDIVNEVYEPTTRRSTTLNLDASARGSLFRPQQPQTPSTPKASATSKPLYVIVFGYPGDKYSVTVEYFRAFGESTEADPNLEISNCFRIGYINPADAMRAVRKNGDVLSGSFMVGVKWADPAQAEALLGSPLARSPFAASIIAESPSPDVSMTDASPSGGFSESSLAISTLVPRAQTPTVGTPIRLAPSASAFRKPGSGSHIPQLAKPGEAALAPGVVQPSPSKGVLGQVSDLIFGW
ncbi:hypothetical protein BDW22DRAFT_1356769 [Trametopsis cervina]|nr:hypothetical protein BDW22DRAFT_1356769 [Trametopsis cervina]